MCTVLSTSPASFFTEFGLERRDAMDSMDLDFVGGALTFQFSVGQEAGKHEVCKPAMYVVML